MKNASKQSLNLYESIEDLPLYNFSKYQSTNDLNWFRKDYTGKETKIDPELLKQAEESIIEEYFKVTENQEFSETLQSMAKIDWLQSKYRVVINILNVIRQGFPVSDEGQECRANLIQALSKHRYKMEIMATPEEDMAATDRIFKQLQTIKTEIAILKHELEKKGKGVSMSLQKQVIMVCMALQIPKINIRETTVLEWIEYCKLAEETVKQN